jgi:hypothetical protein
MGKIYYEHIAKSSSVGSIDMGDGGFPSNDTSVLSTTAPPAITPTPTPTSTTNGKAFYKNKPPDPT